MAVDKNSSSCAAGNRKSAQAELDNSVKDSLQKIKSKFIVMSGKGGVGKTSTSVNLAIALAMRGFQVGLMDVDIHGPDIPQMLGLEGMLDLGSNHKLIPIPYNENLRAVSIESLSVGKDDAIIWRGPMKHSVIQQFIGMVEWGELDFLLIDAPPGTGDEPLSVAQTISDAKAIIVTTPQEVSLADVRKSISFCKTLKMDIFGVIENMSGLTCPHCDCVLDLFGSGGGQKMAASAGIPFLGAVPFDTDMVACGDAGKSFQDQHKESPVTKVFESIAQQMENEL
jgi:Mrp family chromosome partitioning ATPase